MRICKEISECIVARDLPEDEPLSEKPLDKYTGICHNVHVKLSKGERRYDMYKETILKNGMEIVSFSMPAMDSVCLGVWIGIGSRYENEKTNGISHFVEHLLFKGSAKRSGRRIREDIEGAGGSLNGFTGEECTCYLAKMVSDRVSLGMDVLTDMVFNPLIRAEDVEKERGVIREEISRQKDLPMQYVHILFDRLIWGKHPLGFDIAGSIETVNSMTRKDIAEYRKNFYKPGNIIVACAGKLEHEEISEELSARFSQIPSSQRSKPLPLRKRQEKPKLVVEEKKTEQTHICLGTRGLSYKHPDRYVLGVLNVILGGNMRSRLFEEVREKRGLAYHISSSAHNFVDAGVFLISGGVDSQRIEEALTVIIGEIRKISRKNVTKKEISQAKEFLRGQILLSMEDTSHRMLWLGENKLALGRVVPVEETISKIEKVSIGDIRRVAERLFQDNKMNLSLIGPHKREKIEKLFYGELG